MKPALKFKFSCGIFSFWALFLDVNIKWTSWRSQLIIASKPWTFVIPNPECCLWRWLDHPKLMLPFKCYSLVFVVESYSFLEVQLPSSEILKKIHFRNNWNKTKGETTSCNECGNSTTFFQESRQPAIRFHSFNKNNKWHRSAKQHIK